MKAKLCPNPDIGVKFWDSRFHEQLDFQKCSNINKLYIFHRLDDIRGSFYKTDHGYALATVLFFQPSLGVNSDVLLRIRVSLFRMLRWCKEPGGNTTDNGIAIVTEQYYFCWIILC